MMPDDGQKQPRSVADALATGAAPQEDATVQISKTELAAIRESANSPAMSPEVLREINRQRSNQPDEEDEPTQTFDRNSLSSLLAENPSATDEVAGDAITNAAVEQARQAEQPQTDEFSLDDEDSDAEFAGEGLDALSDADLHAVVFGGDDGDEDETFDPLEDALIEELEDFSELDDAEFETLEELTADEEVEPESEPKPGPLASSPPHSEPQPAPALDVDEPIGDYRGAESRLLLAAGSTAGLAMVAAGGVRFATGMLAAIDPIVAGMMIVVGVIILVAALLSTLQRR